MAAGGACAGASDARHAHDGAGRVVVVVWWPDRASLVFGCSRRPLEAEWPRFAADSLATINHHKNLFFFHFLVELFIIFLCVVENYFDEVFKYHFKR